MPRARLFAPRLRDGRVGVPANEVPLGGAQRWTHECLAQALEAQHAEAVARGVRDVVKHATVHRRQAPPHLEGREPVCPAGNELTMEATAIEEIFMEAIIMEAMSIEATVEPRWCRARGKQSID